LKFTSENWLLQSGEQLAVSRNKASIRMDIG
jgi:hypothetical protein